MKNIVLVLLFFIFNSASAKNYYIRANNLRFDLTLNKHTRSLAVSNYLAFKDMGALSYLEKNGDQLNVVRDDNFLRNVGEVVSSDVEVEDIIIPKKNLDKEKFFKCIGDSTQLHSYKLIRKNISNGQKVFLASLFNSCENYLSDEYIFPDQENIFFYSAISEKLDSSSMIKLQELFLTYLDIKISENKKLAIESLLTMLSYDVQFNEVTSFNLDKYKQRLKGEITFSSKKLKDDIEDQSEFVKTDIHSGELIKIVDEI